MASGIVVLHHGCTSGLPGTHHPTIHYTPPRFISKDSGLQLNWKIPQNMGGSGYQGSPQNWLKGADQ